MYIPRVHTVHHGCMTSCKTWHDPTTVYTGLHRIYASAAQIYNVIESVLIGNGTARMQPLDCKLCHFE